MTTSRSRTRDDLRGPVLHALRSAPDGLMVRELAELLEAPALQVWAALNRLQQAGRVECDPSPQWRLLADPQPSALAPTLAPQASPQVKAPAALDRTSDAAPERRPEPELEDVP